MPSRSLQTVCERPGLVAFAIRSPHNLHVRALGEQPCRTPVHNLAGVVVAVVKHLDFVLAGRVLHGRNGFDDAPGHFGFVVDGNLCGHRGPGVGTAVVLVLGDGGPLRFALFFHSAAEEKQQHVQVEPVRGQRERGQDENNEDQRKQESVHVDAIRPPVSIMRNGALLLRFRPHIRARQCAAKRLRTGRRPTLPTARPEEVRPVGGSGRRTPKGGSLVAALPECQLAAIGTACVDGVSR